MVGTLVVSKIDLLGHKGQYNPGMTMQTLRFSPSLGIVPKTQETFGRFTLDYEYKSKVLIEGSPGRVMGRLIDKLSVYPITDLE